MNLTPASEAGSVLAPGDLPFARAAFVRLLDGAACSRAELAQAARSPEQAVASFIQRMLDEGRITLDCDGHITGFGGVSLVPTDHRVEAGGRRFFTWCAYDMVGIPAALGWDATGETRCGHCGTPIVVSVAGGGVAGPPAVVGWYPDRSACSDTLGDFCPFAGLFCDAAHLGAWQEEHADRAGEAVSLEALAERGRAAWGRYTTA